MNTIIFRTDLTAYDFPSQRVVVQHQDGTRCEFNWAFIEEDTLTNGGGSKLPIIKVYTEHNGYHVFYKEDLSYYRVESMFPQTLKAKLKKLWEYWKSIGGYLA